MRNDPVPPKNASSPGRANAQQLSAELQRSRAGDQGSAALRSSPGQGRPDSPLDAAHNVDDVTPSEPGLTTLMTQLVARLFLPASAMIAAATLVKGYTDTGDGFSAGVILSLGVLLQFVAFGYQATMERYPFLNYAVPMAYGGLLLAALVAFGPVLRGDPIMTHYPRPGSHVVHLGSIEVLTAVLFDISVFLIVLGFCVGALGFIARASSSSPFGRARGGRRGDRDQPEPAERIRLTLNEANSPVMTEPIRSEANRQNGEPE